MARFTFRLQTVLEHREREETGAKNDYLDARSATLEQQAQFLILGVRREKLLAQNVDSVSSHQDLEERLLQLDDLERAKKTVIAVLENEEEQARKFWITKQQDLKVLTKLRDDQKLEWQANMDRLEQNALDEWSTQRRAA